MTADTALPDTRTRQRKRTLSSVSFAVHSACGLWLTILLAIVMVSGTVAVFNAEIDWLIYPELRVTPGEARVNPGAIYDAVSAAYPRFGINSVATGVDRDRLAASAFVLQPGGGARYVWIDQWTGAVRGDTPFMTVGRFFDLLHTTLYLPVIGRAFVNFFGVLLLLSMVTGLIAYKKFWRGFLRRPRFRRGARTWLGDLHRLVAIWTVWFSAIIAVTGMWWFYETPLVTMAGAPPLTAAPERPEIPAAELDALGPDTPARLPVARLAERVAEAYPDMRITLIVPPGHAGQPFEFVGDRGEALVLRGGNRVYVNPYSGEIVGSALVETWSAIERIDAAMLPLHYGTWAKRGTADLAVKTVWFLGGAAISFLTFSGLLIYLRRTRRALAELGVAGRLRRRALALCPPVGRAHGGVQVSERRRRGRHRHGRRPAAVSGKRRPRRSGRAFLAPAGRAVRGLGGRGRRTSGGRPAADPARRAGRCLRGDCRRTLFGRPFHLGCRAPCREHCRRRRRGRNARRALRGAGGIGARDGASAPDHRVGAPADADDRRLGRPPPRRHLAALAGAAVT